MTSYFNVCDITVANLNHKNVVGFYDVHLHPPHFEKGSTTHDFRCWLVANCRHQNYEKTFLVTSHAIFNAHLDIFSKCHNL